MMVVELEDIVYYDSLRTASARVLSGDTSDEIGSATKINTCDEE